jgi:uncharacterized protein (TIGR03000 family)
MNSKWRSMFVLVLLTAAVLLCTASPSQAQRFGRNGGNGGYYDNGGYYNPGNDQGSYGSGQTRSYYSGQDCGTDQAMRLLVRIPEQARLWINDTEVAQLGSVRTFQLPPLETGQNYSYDLTARWMDANGQQVERKQSLKFQAGSQALLTANFLASNRAADRNADDGRPAKEDARPTTENGRPAKEVVPPAKD